MAEFLQKEFQQQPNETYDDWKYRIILAKRNGDMNISWNEVCELFNFKSPEYIRKFAAGVHSYNKYLKETYKQNDGCSIPENVINKLDEKKIELQKEKIRMQDQKRELNKLIREWARAEHIMSHIESSINSAIYNPMKHYVEPEIEEARENKKAGVLLLSDWHKGMLCDNFKNTFNDKVFYERINHLQNKVIEFGRDHQVSELHIFLLGDLINGLIHVNTRINNTENVIRQTTEVAEALALLSFRLSSVFLKVKIYSCRGNHERVTPQKNESITNESFFDLIPWYLETRLKFVNNIEIIKNELDNEIIQANILGHPVAAEHGHRSKASEVTQNTALITGTIPEYIFLGHYHSSAEREIHGTEVIVNGSLCGTDEYAINIRKTSKPSQKFMIFDEHGRLCTYNIDLSPSNI